ncbi:MAG: response regulator [Myxococcales bacterium]
MLPWLSNAGAFAVGVLGGGLVATMLGLAGLRLARRRVRAPRVVASDESADRSELRLRRGGLLEQGLRSHARYRAVVEASSSLLWVVDATGSIKEGGLAFKRLTGVDPGAVNPLGWVDAVHELDRPRFLSEWGVGVESGRPFDGEIRMLNLAHGHYRTSWFRAVPVRDEQGVLQEWVLTLLDIEDKRQSERERREIERRAQEAQRMESLGVLAGGVAHDFNNLLVGVMGHAEWLSRRIEAASPLQDNLQRIVTAAERAAQLCKQMLAFAGRGRFLVEPCSVSAIAKEMQSSLVTLAPQGTRVLVQAQPNLAPVEADPTELKQVLLSLVTNSAEAFEGCPGGTITVVTGSRFFTSTELMRTKLGARCVEGEYVFLEVRDDGPGIPADVLPRIFDPFFSTKFMGRGLSLAAVLGIARSHRGTVDVTSAPGEGTCVRMMLPALLAGSFATRTPPPASRSAKGTVLVVDDDVEVRELARLTLEDVGVRVLVACNGDEAIEVFTEMHAAIDLVLLDLTMPGTDSASTLRALRGLKPEICVVLSSGYLPGDAIERIGASGVDGFVQKPWRPSDLVDKLSGLLVRRPSGRFRVA